MFPHTVRAAFWLASSRHERGVLVDRGDSGRQTRESDNMEVKLA